MFGSNTILMKKQLIPFNWMKLKLKVGIIIYLLWFMVFQVNGVFVVG